MVEARPVGDWEVGLSRRRRGVRAKWQSRSSTDWASKTCPMSCNSAHPGFRPLIPKQPSDRRTRRPRHRRPPPHQRPTATSTRTPSHHGPAPQPSQSRASRVKRPLARVASAVGSTASGIANPGSTASVATSARRPWALHPPARVAPRRTGCTPPHLRNPSPHRTPEYVGPQP